LNKKTIEREKEEEGRKRKRKEKRGFKREQGGDVSGHEVSLVTTATDGRRAHL